MTRPRLRELGLSIGVVPTGPLNAITDVDGVAVGHATLMRDEPRTARTGVTVILPRTGHRAADPCYGGYFSFNGNGEMTGSHWLEESGMLSGPIAITNTHQVGLVRDALVEHEAMQTPTLEWALPIVAETYDGFLNDINAFHLTKDDVFAALDAAAGGRVAEGNVGGGTGMVCHEFKGGIGTSSRLVHTDVGTFTIGVLVQANYGDRGGLRLSGRPIGAVLGTDVVPPPTDPSIKDAGSIIVVIATDVPLLADQCKRLARRATVGLARVGGYGSNGSGDIFLAFSTANRPSTSGTEPIVVHAVPIDCFNPLLHATAEAVEEAIWNALCAAETMVGHLGRTVYELPLDRLVEIACLVVMGRRRGGFAWLAVAIVVSALALPASSATGAVTVVEGAAIAGAPATRDRIQVVTFGQSVLGRPIVAYRTGTPGGRLVLVIGNTHGDEPRGIDVTRALRTADVSDDIDLWTIDTINPDGLAANRRTNANGVDLNRNFSVNWGYIAPSNTDRQYSGEAPADQPETQAIQNLITLLRPAITVWYHQAANRVSIGGSRRELPLEYARLVGQITADTPCTRGCTGTGTQYANHTSPSGTAFLVELPGSDVVTTDMIDRHARALLAIAWM